MANKAYKHDWIELKQQWILGEYKSLAEFAKVHDLNYGYAKKIAARDNWYKDREANRLQKSNEIVEKTVAAEIENEVSRNVKHLQAYDLALEACITILNDELKKGVDVFGNAYGSNVIIHSKLARVVESLEKIQKGQRLAEGLDAQNEQNTVSAIIDGMKGMFSLTENPLPTRTLEDIELNE